MNTTTNVISQNASTAHARSLAGEMNLRVYPSDGTASTSDVSAEGAANSLRGSHFEIVQPVPEPPHSHLEVIDSKPIQVWEGVVLSIDPEQHAMDVRLSAKLTKIPDHTACIALEWVHDQDRELAKPGAVFYLTVFRRLSRGSVQNAQEIRFRRLPSWSNNDVRRVRAAADVLAAKMKDA